MDILVALTFAFAGAAAAAEKESGQLKNVVIEGETRLQMKGDKPAFFNDKDPEAPLVAYLGQELSRANPTEKISISYPTYLPAKVASDVVLSPWHGQLVADPVLYLTIKRPAKLTVKEWRLVITDDQGKVFRNMRGSGELPEHVTWNGYGDNGQPLKVGRSYAYSLSILDQADIPTYLFGKTVRLSGFIQERDVVTISMETEVLFKQGPAFSTKGELFMRETQDQLRKKRFFTVQVHGSDLDLAQRQADLIKSHLVKSLHLKEEAVEAKGIRAEGKNVYIRTEVSGRSQ